MNDFLRKNDTDILLHCLTLIIISNIIVINIIALKIIDNKKTVELEKYKIEMEYKRGDVNE